MKEEKIFITRPIIPSLKEFNIYLEDIWESKLLTNNGKYERKLEESLKNIFNVDNICLTNNGTSSLLIGLKSLGLSGEVITTPYTFAATTNSIRWNGLTPVFCDISNKDYNIDVNKIEKHITERTSAILAVHVYGNPCEYKIIKEISEKYDLKVIYDAAHTFNYTEKGKKIYGYGDISILSFHATKVFNTIEGGAVISPCKNTIEKVKLLKNFGISKGKIVLNGINGKMNEIQASFGLSSLKYIEEEISNRKIVDETYRDYLQKINGIRLLDIKEKDSFVYPYFPIFIDKEIFGTSREEVKKELLKNNILTKKYFFPLTINTKLDKVKKSDIKNSITASKQVLCLPLYGSLSNEDIIRITEIIAKMKK